MSDVDARPPARIVLVEDHTLVRQLLAILVRDHGHLQLVAECTGLAQARVVCREHAPDLVVIDWMLPDGQADELIRELAQELPRTRWMVISARAEERVLRDALGLGVHGIVLKQSELATFRTAMERVLAGEVFYCEQSSRLLMASLRADAPVLGTHLTYREREILRGFARGLNPKEIALNMGLSAKTVQNQLSAIRDKLGLHEPAQLLRYVDEHRLLEG